jgi:putative flavoprotein involved in K+ transport
MSSIDPIVIVGAGQSGLAAAKAVRDAGLRAVVLEAGARPVGSWPAYYDSLTLFSPAAYSSVPGAPFDADLDHYPTRDEVVAYLERHAADLGVEIRTNTAVMTVQPVGSGFAVHTAGGEVITAAGLVAATGSFSNPYIPALAGQDTFTGEALHVATYRNPQPYAGKRILVVGGGNSAVQVGYELGQLAEVSLATRAPLTFLPQRHDGADLHYWLTTLGFDDLPPVWLARLLKGTPVLDDGVYGTAEADGVFNRRSMIAGFDDDHVIWADGEREQVDVVVFATGYRPSLGYLRALGALDSHGRPLHMGGISSTHPGLVYVGLEFQRSFASNTLRGVHRDAEYVVGALTGHASGAAALLSA